VSVTDRCSIEMGGRIDLFLAWGLLSCYKEMYYSLGVRWIAVADINGFAPSEDSRKHKFGVGVDSLPRSCAQGKFGQEARVTPVYWMCYNGAIMGLVALIAWGYGLG